MRNGNPAEWQNIVELMKGTSVWEEVKRLYPELTNDNDIADEVLAHYSGRRGAERLREEQRKIARGEGSAVEKARAITAIDRVREALERFWKGVCDFLHIHYTTAEEVADRVMRDLLEGVDPRKFGEADGRLREQFIGEKGAEAADHAEEVTTRFDNLAVAREMEEAKKDAKTIKMATGWERGADGKWRYEIPDIEYVPEGNADLNKWIARQPWSKEYDALCERVFAGETLPEADMKRLDELNSKAQEVADVYNSRDEKILADYVRNDELFKSYPELKRVKVVFVGERDFDGKYSEKENTIYIKKYSALPHVEILAHEIQHAIQAIEGFARGGNPGWFDKVNDMIWDIHRTMDKMMDYYAHRFGLPTFDDWNKSLDGKELKKFKTALKRYLKQKEDFSPIYAYSDFVGFKPEIRRDIKLALNKANKEIAEIRRQAYGGMPFDSFTAYRHLAGEVESRNVQKRLNMTPEERRASLAAETEDVARKYQIFLFGEGGGSHMGSRVDKRMAEIGAHYEGKDLTDAERAVVDVFSGKRDRRSVDITNDKGISIHLEMQQGNESHAGTKHSIFRHVGKDNGLISYDEIRLIPDIVKTGERTDKGKNVVYQKKIDGVRYTVYTDKKSNKEIFHDFYSNRKTAESESLSGESTNTQSSARTSDNAVDRKASDSGVSYTQLSAHANLSDASFDAAKVRRKSESAEKNAENDVKSRMNGLANTTGGDIRYQRAGGQWTSGSAQSLRQNGGECGAPIFRSHAGQHAKPQGPNASSVRSRRAHIQHCRHTRL